MRHIEKVSSRKGQIKFNDPSISLDFLVYGSKNENDVCAYMEGLLPTTYTVRGNVMWFDHYSYEYQGGFSWNVQAHYKKDSSSSELTIKAGGGHSKIYQAMDTIESYECTGDVLLPPDFGGAINVSEHGAEGVDIPVRKFEFSISKKISKGSVSGAYLMNLFNMQNTVNSKPYTIIYNGMILSFPVGSLLFTGFPTKMTSEYSLDITYEFSAERKIETSEGLTIGESNPIEKFGWDYLWVHYREMNDPNNTGFKVKRPIGAYVVRVFKYSDFSKLIL